MPEPNQNVPATVPEQPEVKPPLRKSMPVVIALVVIIGLIGIANLSSLLSGNKKNAPTSAIKQTIQDWGYPATVLISWMMATAYTLTKII